MLSFVKKQEQYHQNALLVYNVSNECQTILSKKYNKITETAKRVDLVYFKQSYPIIVSNNTAISTKYTQTPLLIKELQCYRIRDIDNLATKNIIDYIFINSFYNVATFKKTQFALYNHYPFEYFMKMFIKAHINYYTYHCLQSFHHCDRLCKIKEKFSYYQVSLCDFLDILNNYEFYHSLGYDQPSQTIQFSNDYMIETISDIKKQQYHPKSPLLNGLIMGILSNNINDATSKVLILPDKEEFYDFVYQYYGIYQSNIKQCWQNENQNYWIFAKIQKIYKILEFESFQHKWIESTLSNYETFKLIQSKYNLLNIIISFRNERHKKYHCNKKFRQDMIMWHHTSSFMLDIMTYIYCKGDARSMILIVDKTVMHKLPLPPQRCEECHANAQFIFYNSLRFFQSVCPTHKPWRKPCLTLQNYERLKIKSKKDTLYHLCMELWSNPIFTFGSISYLTSKDNRSLPQPHFYVETKMKRCNDCGKPKAKYFCKKCNNVRYCNRRCQKRDWILSHKRCCI